MSDASRLCQLAYSAKPVGLAYADFQISNQAHETICDRLNDAILQSAYSSLISYAEALAGFKAHSYSWGIVRLYYSSFYSLRSLFLLKRVIHFHSGSEMVYDLDSRSFLKGGRSSHHWNWTSIRKTSVKDEWYASQDSQEAYNALRTHRESVNYTHGFTDPNLHTSLMSADLNLEKRFRVYRDDLQFSYTYLVDHLALAYPTKLIFELDRKMSANSIFLDTEKLGHVLSIWKAKDRCPLTR